MGSRLPILAILAALILLVAAVGLSDSAVLSRFATDTLIKLVVVIGLSVFVGNSGILSFGHASFAMIGAYAAAWFTMPLNVKKLFLPDLPSFILTTQLDLFGGALVGMAITALVALIIGFAVVRLSGIAASIATLAWLVIVYTVYSNADALTKGTSSLVGLPLSTGLATACGAALLALVVAFAFRFSRLGLMLRASREDEVAALASGVAVRRLRLIAFVLSAAIVALGGVLQGHFLGVLSVGQFYIAFTFLTLAMLVVGGLKSLSGAVIGTILLSTVAELLRVATGGVTLFDMSIPAVPGLTEIGLALMMIAILLWRPAGLLRDDRVLPDALRRVFSASR